MSQVSQVINSYGTIVPSYNKNTNELYKSILSLLNDIKEDIKQHNINRFNNIVIMLSNQEIKP